jgi:hypothetical protein
LAWSIGWAGLIVATSKEGFVWAKAALAMSARQILSFLIGVGMCFPVP